MSLAHDRAAPIAIEEPDPADCPAVSLPPEGNVKLLNYRLLGDGIRRYSPTGDAHASPAKGNLVSKFDVFTTVSPPRDRLLELLRPEDFGRDALEAIVRPVPRRGLVRPYDEDTRRFLQRALLTPEPTGLTQPSAPEPQAHRTNDVKTNSETRNSKAEVSLADELREAEEDERSGAIRRELLKEFRRRGGGVRESMERDRLGKLALSVEADEDEEAGLSAAARRLDALLAESRSLHEELAGIHEDLQVQCARACRCAAAARALAAESLALRYLDDVVALLRGDVKAARSRAWPFALGPRQPGRNYVV